MEDVADTPLVSVMIAGRSFVLDDVSGADLIAGKIAEGTYEAPLPALMVALTDLCPGLFLDVGANNGVYSFIVSAVDPNKKIVAFEPYPPVLPLLHRNIELNGMAHSIEVMEFALGDAEGSLPIYVPTEEHGLVETSASLFEGFMEESASSDYVSVRRLDDLPLKEAVGLVKVDIEGFELEFLLGAQATIARDRPIVFAEMLSAAIHKFPQISTLLDELDYVPVRLRRDMAIVTRPIIFDNHSWNYGLIPSERLALFRELCLAQGLEFLSQA